MNTIQTAYVNALLADASYVIQILKGDIPAEQFKTSLTQSQSDFLAANFTVLDSVETPHALGSGFDAVVWQIRSGSALAGLNNENAGKIFVSMRGTQGAEDIADDVALVATGVPIPQIVDMCNWWLRISTASGQQATQIRHQKVGEVDPATGALAQSDGYVLAAPVAGEGIVPASTSIDGVNGHSLGGYLSTVFTRLFGATVQSVSTYNSAGFSNVAASNIQTSYDQISQLVGGNLGKGGFAAVAPIQTNFYAENGWSVTTNNWGEMGFLAPGFNQYGSRTALYQEDLLNGNPIANHSMYKLTDQLALGAALEKLDATFTPTKLNALVKAGSNDMKGSCEGVLDAVRRLVLGADVAATPVSDSDSAPERSTYHQNLKTLTENPAFQALAGKVTLSTANAGLASSAKTDFGAFLSLQALSPIVISTGGDAAATAALKAANPNLSTAWTADYNARLYGDSTKALDYSDNWYTDRAAMLQAIVTRNEQDIGGIVPGNQNLLYQDVASNTEVLVGAGSSLRTQIRFGSEGAEQLEGGSGADTYRFEGVFGKDTVVDADGQRGRLVSVCFAKKRAKKRMQMVGICRLHSHKNWMEYDQTDLYRRALSVEEGAAWS